MRKLHNGLVLLSVAVVVTLTLGACSGKKKETPNQAAERIANETNAKLPRELGKGMRLDMTTATERDVRFHGTLGASIRGKSIRA